jgi:phosphoesterase RecJ-like protein
MRGEKALKLIKAILSKVKTVLVVCHVDPDADTVGSMIAIEEMLKRLNLDVVMFSADPIPHTYHFLPNVSQIRRAVPDGVVFDVAITVDAGDVKRVGEGVELRKLARTIINIDHHPDNTNYGDINYVEPVSSSAELVYDLCGYLNIPISKDIAVCLYTAIITDTGNFRYENTNISTFTIAADLLNKGASPSEIANQIYDVKSIPSLKLLAYSLEHIETSDDGRVVWAVVTDEMIKNAGAVGEEMTGIVDHLRSVKGSQVALLFREHKGKIKINLRSKERVDVQKIASSLGGGGHRRAAGVVLEGSLPEARNRVLEAVRKHLKLWKE